MAIREIWDVGDRDTSLKSVVTAKTEEVADKSAEAAHDLPIREGFIPSSRLPGVYVIMPSPPSVLNYKRVPNLIRQRPRTSSRQRLSGLTIGRCFEDYAWSITPFEGRILP